MTRVRLGVIRQAKSRYVHDEEASDEETPNQSREERLEQVRLARRAQERQSIRDKKRATK